MNTVALENETIPDVASPVRVSIKLNKHCYVAYNKWRCTIDGELRYVTTQRVEFYAMTLQDAIIRFKISEAVEINITWKDPKYAESENAIWK